MARCRQVEDMIQPLQVGLPGAPELVVVLLISLLLVVPLVAVVAAGLLLWRLSGDDERVEQLEAEVRRLRAEVAELESERESVGDDPEREPTAE